MGSSKSGGLGRGAAARVVDGGRAGSISDEQTATTSAGEHVMELLPCMHGPCSRCMLVLHRLGLWW